MYVDSSVIMGMTGAHNGEGFEGIQSMTCRPDTDFFPDLSKASECTFAVSSSSGGVHALGWGGVAWRFRLRGRGTCILR